MARFRLIQVPQFLVGAAPCRRSASRGPGLTACCHCSKRSRRSSSHAVLLLGTSRLGACIRWLALQGRAVSCRCRARPRAEPARPGMLAAGNIALKGIVFPWLLLQLRARADTSREVEPFVGFTMSVLFGVAALGPRSGSTSEMSRPRPSPVRHARLGALPDRGRPVLIISRRKALMQVLGYLMLENGIFVFGVLPSSGRRCWSSWGSCSTFSRACL